MKLWKVDRERNTVRPIEGEPYPGRDAEGETCYKNTHFEDEEDAWERLEACITAEMEMAGRAVLDARKRLEQTHASAGNAVVAFHDYQRHREARRDELAKGAPA